MRIRAPEIARDTILLLAGLSGLFHETVIFEGERPFLLAVFAAMCGLPLFLRTDEKLHRVEPPDVKPPDAKAVGQALLKEAIEEERRKIERGSE